MKHIHISPFIIAETLGAIPMSKYKGFVPIIIAVIMVEEI
jgi:hypothetical protein